MDWRFLDGKYSSTAVATAAAASNSKSKHRICETPSVGNTFRERVFVYAGSNNLLWIGSEEVEFIVVVVVVDEMMLLLLLLLVFDDGLCFG